MKDLVLPIILPIIENIKQNITWENNCATIVDPVFHIKRNRVNAEFCKTLVRLHDDSLVEPLINTLVKSQNSNGSWNEIHPNYNQPSALVTSFIGDALLSATDLYPQNKSLESAKNYVRSQEIEPGYFLKSTSFTADHLNVDASCGAFLAHYGKRFNDTECLLAAERAAQRICDYQISGYYPYTTNKGNYAYIFNVPCIHYQGVTMYYLAKIQEVLHKDWIKTSLLDGAQWLSHTQRADGHFDWSKSGLMFAYYLSGAYAFAHASFQYVAKYDKTFLTNANLAINGLNNCIDSIVLRWEKGSRRSFVSDVISTVYVANMGNYPMKHKFFRMAYGSYRQLARRGFSDDPLNDLIFKSIVKGLNVNYSVIEASKNFHDLFMTTEVLDSLSQARAWRDQKHETD